MQIFLSHSSRQKPLIREIKSHLPEYLGPWIDEEKLLFGDAISASLQSAIRSESDYVLLFIDQAAAKSTWVTKEIQWALETEKALGRTILLPIVIDESALTELGNIELQNRKYLRLQDFLESSIRALALSIASALFALVCRDMERLRKPKPKTPSATIADAETLLHTQAALIQKAVFPHRQSNPISVETLREVMTAQDESSLAPDELEEILSAVVRRNLIPGLVYDGASLFLIEEHASWKSQMQHQNKQKIGRKAAGMIRNGMKVFLDAGSTTGEMVTPICRRIESRALTNITIATTSIDIAALISKCCVGMGFDDDVSGVRLFVPGGHVRPGTQAIVSVPGHDLTQIDNLADYLGGFDLAVVGVNGIDATAGFTTHSNPELNSKLAIIRGSAVRVLAGDSSKIGIVLESKVASFDDDISFIVDDASNSQNLCQRLGPLAAKVILV